jgi:hypothetical protein
VSAVQGVITILAVLVGATATFLATHGIERARWRRERSARWDERRLEAYTEYANAVKIAIIRARSILGAMGLSETLTPLSPQEGLALLAIDENSRTVKLEAVMILGTAETIRAAREWHALAWRFQDWATGRKPTTQQEVEQSYAESQTAREAYYAAVRAELEI